MRRRQLECLQSLHASRASHKDDEQIQSYKSWDESRGDSNTMITSNLNIDFLPNNKHEIHISYGAFRIAMWYLQNADLNSPSMRRCSKSIQDVESKRVDGRFAVFVHWASNLWQCISFELLCRISQCIPLLELACKPWTTLSWLNGHAMYAAGTWDSECAKSVTNWRHLNANHVITWASRSFAMSACKNQLTNVTSVGGKRSFTITPCLLIR